MKIIEWLRLITASYRYKKIDDVGGIRYILSHLEKGQFALDIGSHKGEYLYFMQKKVGETGKVYAFEPQSLLYQYLIRTKEIFNWNNVTIEQLAVSNKAGFSTLFVPSFTFDATILPDVLKTSAQFTEQVRTETLDSYCESRNIIPNLIKIDVEGNELNVIAGAMRLLKRHKPKLLIEIEVRHVGEKMVMETFGILERIGYRGEFIHYRERKPLSFFKAEAHQNIKNLWRNDRRNPYCNNFIFE